MKLLNYGDGYLNTKTGKDIVEFYRSANYTTYDVNNVIESMASTSESGKVNVLIIDSFNIGYKYAYIASKAKRLKYLRDEESGTNIPMGIQDSFIFLTKKLVAIEQNKELYPDGLLVIVVYDPPHKDKAEADATYKQGRKKKDRYNEAIKVGAITMSQLFPNCFVASAGYTEADDVVNSLTERIGYGDLKDKVSMCTIMSEDQDLHWGITETTLMQKKASMFTDVMTHSYDGLFTEQDTIDKFGVPPHDVKYRKMLCGKKSDNWNKLSGYSDREYISFINDNKLTMDNFIDMCEKHLPRINFNELTTRWNVIYTGLNIDDIKFYKVSPKQTMVNPFSQGKIRSFDARELEQ